MEEEETQLSEERAVGDAVQGPGGGSAKRRRGLSGGRRSSASAGCGGLSDFLSHHRGDKLRIIAVSGPKRASSAPDLPTIGELGHPKLSTEGWYGFYAPGKMSPGLVQAWNKELVALLESADIKQKILQIGMEVRTSTPQAFAKLQSESIVSFRTSMQAAGFQPE